MRGHYHSVETCGTVDGPGIRYVLFLSGCPLRCAFCHNPDTWSCGGKAVSVEETLINIKRYRHFYMASGGGITVSGGEPLLQPQFVTSLFEACRKEGIHTLLDTSGYCQHSEFEAVLPFTDMVSLSIKVVDPVKHRKLTGVGNERILANLRYIASQKQVVVRYVVIPGINAAADDLTALAELVTTLPGAVPVELLAYHTFGRSKWEQLGLHYQLEGVPAAAEADMEAARNLLMKKGVKVLHTNSLTLSA